MLSHDMALALRRGDAPKRWMAEFERAGDTLYCWSGEHTISYDGHDWIGVGGIYSVETVDKGDALSWREQQFSLKGLAPQALAGMDEDVSDRAAALWFAMLNGDGQIIRSPLLIHRMKQNFLQRTIEMVGKITLTLICRIALPRFDRASGAKWSHESQQQRFAGDEGLYYLAGNAKIGLHGLDWRPA